MLIKKVALVVSLVLFTLSSALVYAKIKHTLLVYDMKDAATLPNNFRTSSDKITDGSLQTFGLSDLHVIGSQQYSEQGLLTALNHIPSKSVILIDLRKESHGFLNGSSISWYGPQNATNAAKSTEQVELSQARLLKRVRSAHFRSVYTIQQKSNDAFIEKVSRDLVRVKSVKSEQQVADALGLAYKRYYVKDFNKPDDETVVSFVKFATDVPADTWLYFHCRAGKGRTTTFMAMYDMIKNAKNVSFGDIMARQIALGGSKLTELPEEGSFKYQYASKRLKFLQDFYRYVKNNDDNFATTWSEWRSKNNV